MIVDIVDQIPELHGIIFIDCWDEANSTEKKQALDKFYQLIVDNTQQYQFKCAVNAATHLAMDVRDPSVYNTFSMYAWPVASRPAFIKTRMDQLLSSICQYSHRNVHNTPLTTSKIISQNFMQNGKGVVILNGLDLIFHNDWSFNSTCKNWLVVGQSWQNCVHNNNMGLKQFAKLSAEFDITFFATEYSFLKEVEYATHDDFVNDTLAWNKINGFGYQLVPDVTTIDQFPLLRYKYFHV